MIAAWALFVIAVTFCLYMGHREDRREQREREIQRRLRS